MALDQSFQRGEAYYASRAVAEIEQCGNTVTARVWGSQPDAYRVTVELGASGILSTGCSCPYDWGGTCKHIVAVLLTLVRKPDSVEKRPPLDELLAQRSKQDLISLVKEMIVRQPDLARLLDLPLHPESPVTLDLAKFEKQVNYALSREDAEWAGRELKSLNEMANRYLMVDDPTTAGTLYHLILERALVHFDGTAKQKAFLLLELGRIDEAVEIARSHFADLPGLVLDFANRMVDAGHGEAAVSFMVEQVKEGRGFHYKPWLARNFEEQGDAQAALDMWRH